jgi:CheY-like chemotaxis protein
MDKRTILLVEDDELDVISFQRSLKHLGNAYTLFTAFNGREALEMLTRPDGALVPDVILLDLNMPKMNGIEFLTILRKNEQLKNIKVFIITTSTETGDRTATDALGISGYIIKPLSYNDNSRRGDSMEAFIQFHLRKIFSNELG